MARRVRTLRRDAALPTRTRIPPPMQLGMIGLGRMGANMAQRLMRGGHAVVARLPVGETSG